MALFGAPIAHEDHAQRACYAALKLREDLADLAHEVAREYGLSVSTRIGEIGASGHAKRLDAELAG